MSAADKAKEIVQDLTGMWWPAADEHGLREAAGAWRTFAEAVDDCCAAANSEARGVIENNKGPAIEKFDEFWRRYHDGGRGWLTDLAGAARAMAQALDRYADEVAEATRRIEHALEIAGAALVAGTALAVFTGGLSEAAAAAAAATITEVAASAGVAVSTVVAEIAATTLTGVVFGAVESVAVDLAVAQPMRIGLGDQSGLNLDEVHDAATSGAVVGGVLGGAGGSAKAVSEAGGLRNVLGGFRLPDFGGPRLAVAGGADAGSADMRLWMKAGGGDGGAAKPVPPSGHFPEDAVNHVIKGEIKYRADGKPKVVGYHLRPGGKDRPGVKVPKIDDRDNRTGLTRGNVWMRDPRTGEWVMKLRKSTFFPDTWSEKDAARAIRKAFENSTVVDPAKNMWEGEYKGIIIQGYYDPVTGDAITAYPKFPAP
ncbi:EndoU domain-containing protein [Streptacidiphilus sp. ASG 303]|uniref:EndoU domain-containing protein n=1 Tax=Streptacidiphilus sp. ASG 303 TaxID=2896847 RepID=UPI001E4F9357|nr:EndoU domain-containing protein [Streptacidiphilus sp. ASG 303]MCD0483388.1 EndoU domain-containing protein [Streptacidiphilus sp. ASG 303]